MKKHLLLFVKYPEPGRVKTRLIPAVGAEQACRIHRLLAERVAETIRNRPESITVWFDGGDADLMREWLGEFTFVRQPEGDLGVRLDHAFSRSFRNGADSVIAIGSDAPGLSADILDHAFGALERTQAVIGPANDGGYYLIGLTENRNDLFNEMKWGTETVYGETIRRLEATKTSWTVLEPLSDIDRPEDLEDLGF